MNVDAEVIGSGPNGLAAAIELARQGLTVRVREAEPTIGGGTRSAELTLPGFLHDLCSAIHPLGAGSPYFRKLPLKEHGLEWIHPDIPIAHPLDDGTAAALYRSVDQTAGGLGDDGSAYRRLIGPLVPRWDELLSEVTRPMFHLPRHPLLLARFGLTAMFPATTTARLFKTTRARALLAGLAAHSFLPIDAPFCGARSPSPTFLSWLSWHGSEGPSPGSPWRPPRPSPSSTRCRHFEPRRFLLSKQLGVAAITEATCG